MVLVNLLPAMRGRSAKAIASHFERAAAKAADPVAYKAMIAKRAHESYLRNKEKVLQRSKEWHEAHPEYVAAKSKAAWKKIEDDPQRHAAHKAARQEWYRTNPEEAEKCRAATRKWNAENPERKRAQELRKYGLTPDDVSALRETQGGRCAICREVFDPRPRRRHSEHIDHDHETGAVRGLLCQLCNVALGALRDDPALVDAAAAYLRRKKEGSS
jgi:hypothetical protein